MIWNSKDAVTNISSKRKHFTCQVNIKITTQLKNNNHDKSMQCALRTTASVSSDAWLRKIRKLF